MLIKWTERKFNFDFPADLFEPILIRLRHTPLRYRAIVKGLTDDQLSLQVDGKWSIKENVGHIPVLDRNLWSRRLEQFMTGEAELIAADMSNQLTSESGFSFQPIEDILELLESQRAAFMVQLDNLRRDDYARTAHHPRLNTPMRLVDMLAFIAEHDDYHLAHIFNLRQA